MDRILEWFLAGVLIGLWGVLIYSYPWLAIIVVPIVVIVFLGPRIFRR